MFARNAALLLMIGCALSSQGWRAQALAGLYRVDPALTAPGAREFASLASAVTALSTRGLSAPVVIELVDSAGPYRERMPFLADNVVWGANDAVLVLEQFPGADSDRRVTFRPAPGHRPVLDATGRAMGIFWNGADYVTVEGLTIRNASHDAISLYSEFRHGAPEEAHILGCHLHDCGGAGVVLYGNLPAPRDTLIANTIFRSLQRAPAGGLTNSGRFAYLNLRRTEGTRILHNTFIADTGLNPWFAVVGALPGSLGDQPASAFLNNVIVKSTRSDRPALFFASVSGIDSVPARLDGNLYDAGTAAPLVFAGDRGRVSLPDLATWRAVSGGEVGSRMGAAGLPSTGAAASWPVPIAGGLAENLGVPVLALATDAVGVHRLDRPDAGALQVDRGATISSLGGAGTNSNGTGPRLRASSAPRLGTRAFTITMEDVQPGSIVWWFAAERAATVPVRLGDGQSSMLDWTSYLETVNLGYGIWGPMLAVGNSVPLTLDIPNHPWWDGYELHLQALAIDPAQAFGPLSDALRISFAR